MVHTPSKRSPRSLLQSSSSKPTADAAPLTVDRRRVVIESVRPTVDCGRLPAKATRDLPLHVSATVYADSHDPLIAWVRHGAPGQQPNRWAEERLTARGNDRYDAWITPTTDGRYCFSIVALPDEYGAWLHDFAIRIEAGQDVNLDIAEGAAMAERRAAATTNGAQAKQLAALAKQLSSTSAASAKLAAASKDTVVALMQATEDRSNATTSGPFELWVERPRAGFSAWYEMFPRSEGATPTKSGTFSTAQRRLEDIAATGFDVVYLPPIHPIGVAYRKGRNNSLQPNADDPGSPWAIGGKDGGHTSVHPDLGTLQDFDAFVNEAKRNNLEVALDYALQCSPDHPWVKEHPQWFKHRADGTIRYAENPPKKYQDIYPLDFDSDDAPNLWKALRDVMRFWADRGVRIFRVDNPHTKPFAFWRWLIHEMRASHPDVLLLAEAFIRPAVMQHLAKIGFSQSYTYFTWRNAKWELEEYLLELSQTDQSDWFRPNFWVNTPDILHATLQRGGLPAFRLRAVLAAITGPSWGMYSGYELGENTPVREGSEEYLDSEKYQYRPRNWDQPHSLAPLITQLNELRRRHPQAIAQLDTLRIHHIGSEHLLCVSRSTPTHDDVLLLVVNLDPYAAHDGMTWLDLAALGIAGDTPFQAHDELTGATFTWHGAANYVRLDPSTAPAHVLHLTQRR
ncbi:MAG: maltotransferase domain-containing protein [Candidatus Dormibacteria bacterium]